jgi:hypothetical protein
MAWLVSALPAKREVRSSILRDLTHLFRLQAMNCVALALNTLIKLMNN